MADSKEKREMQAEHKLLDQSGTVVEAEESAFGISYKHLKTGETFTWTLPTQDAAVSAETRMLAIFGAKTLATNVASASKTRKDGVGAVPSIQERFDLIRSGTWVDRTVGPRYDTDILLQAIAAAKAESGQAFDEAATRAKLESEDKTYGSAKNQTYAAFAMTNKSVRAHYDALRPAKAEAELGSL